MIMCIAGSQLFQMQSGHCKLLSFLIRKYVFVFAIRIFFSFVTSLIISEVHTMYKTQQQNPAYKSATSNTQSTEA